MGVPALTKGPWTFSVNHDCSEAAVNDTSSHAGWQIKESLVSFPAWSVIASSDGSSVKNIGEASPDLWTAWSDVQAGSGAHSWIILENSVTGGQLCLDFRTTVEYQVYCLYSATGAFAADGTTSARPTDTESTTIMTNNNFVDNSGQGAIVHCMICDDDTITRIIVMTRDGAGHASFFCGLETLTDTPIQWIGTHKQAVIPTNVNVNCTTLPISQAPQAVNYSSASAMAKIYLVDSTPYEGWNSAYYTTEGYRAVLSNVGYPPPGVNLELEWAGGYPVSPIGTFRNVVTRGGSLGIFQDIYWGHTVHTTMDTYPASGAKSWIKFGCFMIPWNGSTPLDVP